MGSTGAPRLQRPNEQEQRLVEAGRLAQLAQLPIMFGPVQHEILHMSKVKAPTPTP